MKLKVVESCFNINIVDCVRAPLSLIAFANFDIHEAFSLQFAWLGSMRVRLLFLQIWKH